MFFASTTPPLIRLKFFSANFVHARSVIGAEKRPVTVRLNTLHAVFVIRYQSLFEEDNNDLQ